MFKPERSTGNNHGCSCWFVIIVPPLAVLAPAGLPPVALPPAGLPPAGLPPPWFAAGYVATGTRVTGTRVTGTRVAAGPSRRKSHLAGGRRFVGQGAVRTNSVVPLRPGGTGPVLHAPDS